jgi:beta-N-acetylhexosaminidase
MKKVWRALSVLLLLAFSAKAESPYLPLADRWVDSLYQRLTVAERIGQLIDFRIAPDFENIDRLEALIHEYHVGAITLSGGDAAAALHLIKRLRTSGKVPVYISCENDQWLSLPFHQKMQVPLPGTLLAANDPDLFSTSFDLMADIYDGFGIKSHHYNPIRAKFGKDGLRLDYENEISSQLFADLPELYRNRQMAIATDLVFDFKNDLDFSPNDMEQWNASEWKQKISQGLPLWEKINNELSIINISHLPYFPESEAASFNKKVIEPLLWKHLQFAGLFSADYNHIIAQPLQKNEPSTVIMLMKTGVDKIITSTEVGLIHASILEAIEGREIKKNELSEKVKRNLRLKYQSGMYGQSKPLMNEDHIALNFQSPEMALNSYRVFLKATEIIDEETDLLPIRDVEHTSFASLSLGISNHKTFQETLEKYAPFVHYMLQDISFNPYDLNVLSGQLPQFECVIIGLHTNDLISFDDDVLKFLQDLNKQTKVVIVFFGNSLNPWEFSAFPVKIQMHEDNDITQQIAAFKIFGGDDPSLQRLSYALPEMQGMDSRTLKKIDQVIEQAIKIGATPGCQVLVARNGSVVLERGFGYYTYDSIMPVDTRTIYDLASITKVAATTQSIMKLYEQGLVNLDHTFGTYLPELVGTNKENLIIKDVLAHQSGLRAFYPFWQYTIQDNEQVLKYYKQYPDTEYQNTVAYGMFAGENLKDSLWRWTIDTQLRKNRSGQYVSDYKYSDLGFYLIQMLSERISGTPLDVYTDSLFYRPMGMSSLAFNPLCKFQLNRITPTERDDNFRHVLVWGTVHDQIAAMKGGVSGHAGLFSNTHDIAKLLQMHLQGGNYGGKKYFEKYVIDEFTSYQSVNSRRGLGWDKPERRNEYNPVSSYASCESYGHSGFTGTIAWADPTFNLVFVFLSNRVYPNSDNNKINEYNIRKRIQDLVYESMWSYEKQNN